MIGELVFNIFELAVYFFLIDGDAKGFGFLHYQLTPYCYLEQFAGDGDFVSGFYFPSHLFGLKTKGKQIPFQNFGT